MRGWTVTFVILACAAVVLALFIFLFRNQMEKRVNTLKADNEALHKHLDQIQQEESSIGTLAREIPQWKAKVSLYEAAIPTQIEDNTFLNSLREEMKAQGVTLLSVELTPGGSWLGDIKAEEAKKLTDIGIDVDAARNLKVAFYSIKLLGPYDRTLAVLENLKRHRRMYSIDEVIGPAGSGGGTVTQVLSAVETPVQVTGKIFYGIPADYVSAEDLDGVYDRVVLRPLAGKIKQQISGVGQNIAAGKLGGAKE